MTSATAKPIRASAADLVAEPFEDATAAGSRGLLGTLLAPLRAPERVMSDIATIASAVLSLQHNVEERLASVDERAGALLAAVGALRLPLERVDRKMTALHNLEEAVTLRMDDIQRDLNARMISLEEEVHSMRRPIEQMARELSTVVALLPSPHDGPLARLRDSLSPNS